MSKYISGIKNSNISIPPSGNITTTNTVSSFSNGSAGNPSITFTSDLNTGIYRINEDIIGFSTNGVERMRITNIGTQVSSLNITGLMTTYGGAFIASADNIPAQTNFGLYIAGNPSSSISGRIYVGDGTGWSMHLSKRVSSTNTDLFTFSDSGALTITTALTASSTLTGSLILNGIGMGGGKIYTSSDIINTGGYYYGKDSDTRFTTLTGGAYIRLDNTGNLVTLYDNVTIGNSVSQTTRLLDVQGNIRMTSLTGGGNGFALNSVLTGLEWYMQTSGISGTAPFNPRVSYSIKQVTYNGTGNVRLDFNSCGSSNTADANILTMTLKHGNVGIGTNDPQSSLHVVGARLNTPTIKGIHLGEGGTDDYAIDISAAGSTNNSYIDFTYAGQDSRGRILYAHSTNAMTFNTNGINERMRISSSGNIGIGTTNTNALLQLSNAQSNRKIVIYEEANDEHQFHGFGLNSGVLRYQISATSNSHVFYAATSSSASTELFRIAGSGTTTATGSLVITNSTNTANLETLQLSNSSGTDPNFRLVATKGATTNTDGDVIVRLGLNYTSTANSFIRFHRGSSTTGGFMSFSTNTDIERMRIEGSGEVGIGTSDPQRLLHVNGSPIRVDRDYTSGSGGSMYLVTMNSTTIVGSWNIASTGVTSNPDFTIAYTNASAGGAATRTPFYILGSNGNVGVNVSNPLSALHVGGRMFVDNGVIQRGGTAITATSDLGLYSRTSGNFIRYVTNAADHVWFNTDGANGIGSQEAMRLFNNWFSSGTALRVAGRIIIATTGGTTPGDYGWVITTSYPDTFLENLEFATYDDEGYIVKGYIEDDDNTSYRMNDFTGSHRCKYNIEDPDNKIGLIAISTGEYCTVVKTEETTEVKTGKDAITIFDSLPIVELCTTQNDKRCFGVISGLEDPNQTKRGTGIGFKAAYPMPEGDQRLEINGVGEGAIWVCNINNNIENGDYISSSNVPGYGMKQDSDNLKNYTVAKATCDVNFEDLKELTQKYQVRFLESSGDIITEEVYLKDTQDRYIAVFIGCTYHCG